MGKLIMTENGQTTVRNFTHIVMVSQHGRLGRPEPFTGTMHLVTGVAQRTLEVTPGSEMHQTLYERLVFWVSLLITGAALHRWFSL